MTFFDVICCIDYVTLVLREEASYQQVEARLSHGGT